LNVMRTPWRFVADLVSRKPKPNSQDESPAAAPKTIALEYRPAPEEEHPSPETPAVALVPATVVEETSPAPHADQEPATAVGETAPPIEDDVAEVPVAVAKPAERSAPPRLEEKSFAPVPARTETAEALVKPASTRRKKVEPIAEPAVSVNQAGDVVLAVAADPKSFMDEMADLDAEVDALRRQLARKLVEQNAQLRKMLARFDVR